MGEFYPLYVVKIWTGLFGYCQLASPLARFAVTQPFTPTTVTRATKFEMLVIFDIPSCLLNTLTYEYVQSVLVC